jgi:hypothetical protein
LGRFDKAKCDSEAVSDCVRCNVVFVARSLFDALDGEETVSQIAERRRSLSAQRAASAMSAGTAETPQAAQGEARQRDGEAGTPNLGSPPPAGTGGIEELIERLRGLLAKATKYHPLPWEPCIAGSSPHVVPEDELKCEAVNALPAILAALASGSAGRGVRGG